MATTERAQTTLVDEFRERAAPLGVTVEQVPTSADGAAIIAEVALAVGTTAPLMSPALYQAAPALAAALASRDLTVRLPESVEDTVDAALGISVARQAIAETGSALLDEADVVTRAVSMLSLTHVIVCPTDALVPDLDAAAATLREIASRPGGGYATIVTGPSRTADIERVLTVGVQGPGKVYVLFVDALQ